jgi:hypothetical protein
MTRHFDEKEGFSMLMADSGAAGRDDEFPEPLVGWSKHREAIDVRTRFICASGWVGSED